MTTLDELRTFIQKGLKNGMYETEVNETETLWMTSSIEDRCHAGRMMNVFLKKTNEEDRGLSVLLFRHSFLTAIDYNFEEIVNLVAKELNITK